MNKLPPSISKSILGISWACKSTWRKAMNNTLGCLIGCSIGDFGTIAFFQLNAISWPTSLIMLLAIINGLLTSITLETFLLLREMTFRNAIQTAIGMSIISMLAMEIAMNAVDWWLTGGAQLTIWVIPIMLIAGFLAPLPYNYWRLKALGASCH